MVVPGSSADLFRALTAAGTRRAPSAAWRPEPAPGSELVSTCIRHRSACRNVHGGESGFAALLLLWHDLQLIFKVLPCPAIRRCSRKL